MNPKQSSRLDPLSPGPLDLMDGVMRNAYLKIYSPLIAQGVHPAKAHAQAWRESVTERCQFANAVGDKM